jgi:hypothetical protein
MPTHLFQPGKSGNPKGPPLGTTKGRSRALKALDEWFEDEGNRKKYIERLTQEAMRYPIRFARDVLIPLLPKDILAIREDGDGKPAVWRFLTEVGTGEAQAEQLSSNIIEAEAMEVPDVSGP